MSYKVVESVLDNGPADPSETLVLVAIAENANDAGYGFPGVPTVARRARCCERHALRLIKKMAVDGWLVILGRAAGFGKKQTAYQLNLTKLASNVSHATQIADEKDKRAQRRQLKEDSHAAQMAHETSSDIVPLSQVTFHPVSSDISALPILKNHEPSLEPSGAVAPERVFNSVEDHAQTPQPKPELVKPRTLTDQDVELIRLAYPRKVAPVPARKAIRAQHALLMRGGVTTAAGIIFPRVPSEEATAYLMERTKMYADSPKGRIQQFIPNPATWFNAGSYTEDKSTWDERSALPIRQIPPTRFSDPEAMNA